MNIKMKPTNFPIGDSLGFISVNSQAITDDKHY
jgi:hypothetical protein